MTRSKRLEPIVEYKDKQQKQSLQDMADSKQRWEQQEAQLNSLNQYLKEYQNQQSQLGTMNIVQIQENRRFINQLEETIKQQKNIVQMAEKEYHLKQTHWINMKNNANAVEHLVDNIQQQEIKQLEKTEQKILDEFGLRKFIQRER